jgi:hypothetical protein
MAVADVERDLAKELERLEATVATIKARLD